MVIKKIYNRIILFGINKKPNWINKLVKDLVFKFNFIPDIFVNRKFSLQWENKGIHISSTHYYHPLPNLLDFDEKFWEKEFSMEGVNTNMPLQLELLKEFKDKYACEFNLFPIYKNEIENPWEYFVQNSNFTSVDGEILYSLIRKYQPNKLIEIGSGYSTFLISKALKVNIEKNKFYTPRLVCIEPFPRKFFKDNVSLLGELIEKPVQIVDITLFQTLAENDFLFIDSSHMLKYGSDVEAEIFTILPKLAKGVIIHFHDIFWPKNYPEKWIKENGWYWNEQHFLHAFLMFNESFEIIWCASMMHKFHSTELNEIINSYSNLENPGSLWIRKIK